MEYFIFSIRGLTISEPKKIENIRNVNYNAGADILHRYQLQWNELHELAEENAKNAQNVDSLIAVIHQKLEREWKNILCLNNTLVVIPKVNDTIKNLTSQIGLLFLDRKIKCKIIEFGNHLFYFIFIFSSLFYSR